MHVNQVIIEKQPINITHKHITFLQQCFVITLLISISNKKPDSVPGNNKPDEIKFTWRHQIHVSVNHKASLKLNTAPY